MVATHPQLRGASALRLKSLSYCAQSYGGREAFLRSDPGDLRLCLSLQQNPLWGCMWVMRSCEWLLLGAKGDGEGGRDCPEFISLITFS